MFYKKRRGKNPDDEVRERVKPNKDNGFRDFTTTKIVDLLKICKKNLARGMSMSRAKGKGRDPKVFTLFQFHPVPGNEEMFVRRFCSTEREVRRTHSS